MSLHRFSTWTAVATLALLIAGGLVTSTDSGLAVPDWPLSYGRLFPPMVGGILYEHSHRMIAAVVGLMIAILAGWLWFKEPRRWVRGLGYGAFVAVILQALLGGLTVLWMLPVSISVAHACLGQIVFCLVICLSLVTSFNWQGHGMPVEDLSVRSLCVATTSVLFLQLFLGAVVRHSGGALASHIVGAVVIAAMVGLIIWRLMRGPRRHPPLLRMAMMMAMALGGQVALGILVLLSGAHVAITTAHVALGAMILASSCGLTLMASRFRSVSKTASRTVFQELVA